MKHIALILALTAPGITADANVIPKEIEQLVTDGQYDKALVALQPLQSASNAELRIEAALETALIYYKQGKYETALNHLNDLAQEKSLSLASRHELSKLIGMNARKLGNYQQAQEGYERALELAKILQDEDKIANSYGNLGVLADSRGELKQALALHLQAQKMLEGSENWQFRGANYYNLGDISKRLGDLPQAEHFLSLALDNDKRSGDLVNVSGTAIYLAEIQMAQNRYPEAKALLEEAIAILAPVNGHLSLSRAYNSLNRLYRAEGNLHLALDSAQKSLNHVLQTQSPVQQVYAYLHLIELHLALGNGDLAQQFLETTQPLVSKLDNLILTEKYHNFAAQVAIQRQDYANAVVLLQQQLAENKQLSAQQLEKQLQEHRRSMDSLTQQQKLLEVEQDRKYTITQLENSRLSQQRWALAFALALVFVCTFIYLYMHKRRHAALKAELYEASIRQKDQMLADISHELRTPLSVLKLHIEAMEYNLIDDKTLAYSKINDKINQLNHLISDVYQLSQAENNSLTMYNESHNIYELMIGYSYDMQRMVSQHKLRFFCDIMVARDVFIEVDKSKLDRIINNLTKNACLYTDSPGQVRLKVRLNPSMLFIQIDDSSPGVTDEQLEKLFERLYRVDTSRSRASGGSGLGLSICQSLVKSMQGKIAVMHGKHGGICVRILLPYQFPTEPEAATTRKNYIKKVEI
ncbi:tetratricopeptide repeat protein [Pseudoalteromonas fenneropenaei]|uniref:histidine kinase n=1 Tax=Pseudoalteromonas fenneropenaei TaxID=1737459 RepID=A0ABV7CJ65_9GAMM